MHTVPVQFVSAVYAVKIPRAATGSARRCGRISTGTYFRRGRATVVRRIAIRGDVPPMINAEHRKHARAGPACGWSAKRMANAMIMIHAPTTFATPMPIPARFPIMEHASLITAAITSSVPVSRVTVRTSGPRAKGMGEAMEFRVAMHPATMISAPARRPLFHPVVPLIYAVTASLMRVKNATERRA